MSRRRFLRPQARISYYEPEEPSLDEYIYCEKCADYVYEYCSIHGPLLVIPDDKVPAKHNFPSFVPRAALTVPRVFLHLNYSTIPGAGLGVFSTLTLPKGVRFGPYRGVRTKLLVSDYSWQIYDRERRPSHVVDASDANNSNWMRYVNCARHWREQNLVAFQYRGELYYRTIKIIPRYTELMVFYGSQYANKLHVDLSKYNAPKTFAQKFGAPALKKRKISPNPTNSQVVDNVSLKTKEDSSNAYQQLKQPTAHANCTRRNGGTDCTEEVPATKRHKTEVVNKQPAEGRTQKLTTNVLKPTKPEDTHTPIVVRNINNTEHDKKLNKHKPKLNKKISATTANLETENIPIGSELVSKDKAVEKENVLTNIKQDTHQRKKQNVNIINTQDAYFTCDVCKYKTVTKEKLNKHMRFHDSNRKFECNICSYKFTDNAKLNSHMLSHDQGTSSVQTHKCNICEYTTVYKTAIKQHLLKHSGLKPYSCNMCDYKCTRAGNLKSHIRTHNGEKPYSCNMCDYKCTLAGNLKSHIRTHNGEKPYSCNMCDYKCTLAGNLKSHIRTHNGEKPYSCNMCDYKCTLAGNLKSHIRTHNGEKPYSCNMCDYKCTQAGSLKSHIRTHNGEKPYSCNMCDYKCTQAGSLKSHIRTHNGEKPYSCNICEYKCSHTNSLKYHLIKKHLSSVKQ